MQVNRKIKKILTPQATIEGAGVRLLVLFDQGEQLSVIAVDEPLRFLLLSGKPLHEPVAWQGPIVMNTQAELTTAFQEYWNGTFIKNN